MNSEEERLMDNLSTSDDRAVMHDVLSGLETLNVVNRDNHLLHPWGPIGHVDEVNGPGAVEHQDFQPTHHELLQLVKYWWKVVLDVRFFCFIYETSGSTEIRLVPFAMRRVDRIAECVGEEAVREAIECVEQEFAKTADPEAWRVFKEGTSVEIHAFHAKVQAELHG